MIAVGEGWTRDPLFWQQAGDEGFIESNIRSFSAPFGAVEVEPLQIIEGDYPVVGQNQVVIERRISCHGRAKRILK